MTLQTVILAGRYADARRLAEARGLRPPEWFYPPTVNSLKAYESAPVYVHFQTFPNHPQFEKIADWFSWRIEQPTAEETEPKTSPKPRKRAPKMPDNEPVIDTPLPRPWFTGIARQVGLDYLNQTDGNVCAIDNDGDRWIPDPITGIWTCTDLDDQIAPEFGPFDVYSLASA